MIGDQEVKNIYVLQHNDHKKCTDKHFILRVSPQGESSMSARQQKTQSEKGHSEQTT